MLRSPGPFLAAVVLVGDGARLVAAYTNDRSINHSEAVIGLQSYFSSSFAAASNGAVSAPLLLAHDPPTSLHPSHSPPQATSPIGCSTEAARMGPPPVPPPLGSEYPPATAADYAPPPYVKEDVARKVYTPPPGPPPPGIDAIYSPPPGPPPRAHISHNSADLDFSGGVPPSTRV
ncbi:hypothetical protein MVEN_00727700 [Mycena venus]|uniref:Uncharacterized protein n=1 Tax=Mycena venus TaxID=2733690 RepID=A0A8H6YF41_9AGAR|nr:hypothetical protein MVEN_00727700 [Mycena venus]